MNAGRDRLWLALRLGDLPLSALDAALPLDEPIVVAEQRRVVFCSPAARSAGLQPGMDLTTARLLADCQVLTRQPRCETRALQRLRDRLYSLTPHIEIRHSPSHTAAGLLLEISTCLRLFGGFHPLLEAACALLTDHELHIGLGHTAPGSWLLSFADDPVRGNETVAVFTERLDRLPLQLLSDHPKAVESLLGMGFVTLGDVVTQVRSSRVASLTRRLGGDFTDLITAIYGLDRDFSQGSLFSQPASQYRPEEHFRAHIDFDYPVTNTAHLQPALESLLQQLADFLRERQLACQHIQWRLTDIQRREEWITVRTDQPQSHWQLLYDLTRIQLDAHPLPFEVDGIELRCPEHTAWQADSQQLDFTGEARRPGHERELAVTMARLKSRVGEAAVHKVSYHDSLAPELSHRIIGLAEHAIRQLPDRHRFSLRPTWLLAEPAPAETRGHRLYWQGYLTLAVGPERITGHWWDEPIARDYYLARRQDNVAVWLYQDLNSRAWFVHGVFG